MRRLATLEPPSTFKHVSPSHSGMAAYGSIPALAAIATAHFSPLGKGLSPPQSSLHIASVPGSTRSGQSRLPLTKG